MVRAIDLGKELDKIITAVKGDYGDALRDASGDKLHVLIDKAEMEACDKIKTIPQGQGIQAYGVV